MRELALNELAFVSGGDRWYEEPFWTVVNGGDSNGLQTITITGSRIGDTVSLQMQVTAGTMLGTAFGLYSYLAGTTGGLAVNTAMAVGGITFGLAAVAAFAVAAGVVYGYQYLNNPDPNIALP